MLMSNKNFAGAVAVFGVMLMPTAALANQTGTRLGPYLPTASDAIASAPTVAEQACSAFGGAQSYEIVRIQQNAGYFAALVSYVCNQ